MILVYDKTFEGFLTLVYEVYYEKLQPKEIVSKVPDTLLLDEIVEIKEDKEKSFKVLEAIKKKFPKKCFELILNIFMCDTKEFELELLKYIILGFKDSNELFNINQKEVFYLQNLEKELFRHVHKMYGFTRFEELEDGTLYAKIETKFNVVYFLGKHFLKRLNNQNYIIHDINRKLAFIKNNEYLGVQNIAYFEEPKLSQNEEKFRKLWTTFFEAVAIQTRENRKCQQNFVPLLYRTYMTEFL
ncbi:DNA metabolism protein [Arcobacter sp. CECT 8983]|uniref:TIGR03915 family putative DNA repair protein n=1 Tax=Arcobacter sp. CECT 8983 TaxID=2044508 RepID=UPI00100AC7F5|nr:TIGR03915 family putative DNA repair protein [Arcobacter sp. CECT 8983]RXJ90851.1 DNA metabolism protein [Arcobacter sp. CECT 8983]